MQQVCNPLPRILQLLAVHNPQLTFLQLLLEYSISANEFSVNRRSLIW